MFIRKSVPEPYRNNVDIMSRTVGFLYICRIYNGTDDDLIVNTSTSLNAGLYSSFLSSGNSDIVQLEEVEE